MSLSALRLTLRINGKRQSLPAVDPRMTLLEVLREHPFTTFVQLQQGGAALPLTWTPDFWRKLETRDGDRVVGARRAVTPADFHADEQEMHPEGDELLYLLTGEVDVLLEEADGERMIQLRGGQGCIVPRGVWHRLVLRQPSDLLFVTPPRGTQLRPVSTTERA